MNVWDPPKEHYGPMHRKGLNKMENFKYSTDFDHVHGWSIMKYKRQNTKFQMHASSCVPFYQLQLDNFNTPLSLSLPSPLYLYIFTDLVYKSNKICGVSQASRKNTHTTHTHVHEHTHTHACERF